MRVLFLCGTYPPKQCGVGDYTSKLISALAKNKELDIKIIANINWSVLQYFKLLKDIRYLKPDILHIQYPSLGFGFSLLPQLLSFTFKSFVTIHEFSQAHFLRKAAIFLFSFNSKLIFTSSFEKRSFYSAFSFYKKEAFVLPLGTNITKGISENDKKQFINVINFGQIRPQKGIESVVELAEIVRIKNLPYKIIIAGSLLDGQQSYYQNLLKRTENLPVIWRTNLTESEASSLLANNYYAYLPFPDGASERRGSLLAAFTNEMLVFTTFGLQTTDEIKECVIEANSPSQVAALLNAALSENLLSKKRSLIDAEVNYMKRLDWDYIAGEHLKIYKN